jgi:hypothetical protein
MSLTSCLKKALALGVLLTAPAEGQLISLKTVPIAAGDQFLIFPSENLAMGGVSIALDDRYLDPFVNPAMGARFGEPQFFSSPTFYSVSNSAGSARTLPVGGGFASSKWFGTAFAAFQNLKRGEQFFFAVPEGGDVFTPNGLSSRSATNKYANLSIGRLLGQDFSIGVSGLFADLGGIDGVEHLYAAASGIAQRGNMIDLRVGLSKIFAGDRRLEGVALFHSFNMTHDVFYVDFVPVNPNQQIWEPQSRMEENQDHTRTYGANVGYHQPVGENGWRMGGNLTYNHKTHPKIPNYEIMNIPRDPGYSNAMDIGIGVSKVTEKTRFGIDLSYQPAGSETWAEAEDPVPTSKGDTIPTGGKTVENSFDFSNTFVSMGVTHDVGIAGLQLGLQMKSYGYHLDQWDNVAESFRRQDEEWTEWVPSWGIQLRFSDFELRYLGRVTTGTGRPGVAWSGAALDRAGAAEAATNDVLLAPSGPLTLQDATVLTNQFTVSIPIR